MKISENVTVDMAIVRGKGDSRCELRKNWGLKLQIYPGISVPMNESRDIVNLGEGALKCLFLEHLRRQRRVDPGSVIASEYALGRAGRRIDLAIWNGEFVGIEFKSKLDSLKRLPFQLKAYLECFDRVILVVDQKHGPKAMEKVPVPVELWTVDELGQFTLMQAAGVVRTQSAQALANLCSVVQLRRLVPEGNRSRQYRGRLDLSLEVQIDDVYAAAIEAFKRSFASSSQAFWNEVESKCVDSAGLRVLSRFSDLRARRHSIERDQKAFWQEWTRQATESLSLPPDII